MKIGVICDGDAEVLVLNEIFSKINIDSVQFLNSTYADMQPLAPIMQIVAAAESRINFYRSRGVDRIIVVIDRENSAECPGARAQEIKEAFHAKGHTYVEVVVKNRKLENWLISDPDSINTLKLFSLPSSISTQINNGGCDSISDAQRELEKASKNGYSKRRDAIQIARKISAELLEKRSRSFRKLLRVSGHARYALQSRLWAP